MFQKNIFFLIFLIGLSVQSQTISKDFRKKIEALGYKRVAKIVNEEIFVYIGI